jgi:hypothetical protein
MEDFEHRIFFVIEYCEKGTLEKKILEKSLKAA